jgi:hypothetical protein
MAQTYVSLKGNKFDKGISKLLKNWRKKHEKSQSPDQGTHETPESDNSPSYHQNASDIQSSLPQRVVITKP